MDKKLLIKIERGTRSDNIRLCDTCSNGQVMRGPAESEEVVYCHYLDKPITLQVVECTNYQDKSKPTLGEMKTIAWMLRTDRTGHKIGFASPSQRSKERAERRANGIYDDFEDFDED